MSLPVLLLRRLAAGRARTLTGGLLVLLVAALLSATAGYAESTARDGLREAIGTSPPADRFLTVDGSSDLASVVAADPAVRAAVAEAYRPVAATVLAGALGGASRLTGADGASRADDAALAWLDDASTRVRLLDGRWPAAGAAQVEVLLPMSARDAASTGEDGLVLVPPRGAAPLPVRVVGVYESLGAAGQDDLGLGTAARGPILLVASPEALRRVGEEVTGTWRVEVDVATLDVNDVAALAAGVERLLEGGGEVSLPRFLDAESGLPERLREVSGPLAAARAAVLMPVLQVLALGAAALMLVVRAGRDGLRETALARARGLSGRQLAVPAAAEVGVMVLPALVLAPTAGSALAELLGAAGVPGGFDRQIPAPWWPVLLFAVLVAAVLFLTAVVPGQGPSGRRHGPLGWLYRRGFDVALAGVAVLGCAQLLRYGAAPVAGRGVDALQIVVPALTAVSGTALLIRALPVLTGRFRGRAGRGRGAVWPVSASMADQRPLRSAGAVFVVALAVSIGALTASYAAAWSQSQQDQADFAVGADVRAVGPVPTSLAADLRALTGAMSFTPGWRGTATVDSGSVGALALDSAQAVEVMRWREDLRPAPLPELLRELAPRHDLPDGLMLPPASDRLTIVASAAATDPFSSGVQVVPVLRDAFGLFHRLDAVPIPFGGVPTRRTVDVDVDGPVGEGWSLQALEVVYVPPSGLERDEPVPSITVDVRSVTADAGPQAFGLDADGQWQSRASLGPLLRPKVTVAASRPDSLLRLTMSSGAEGDEATVALRPPSVRAATADAAAVGPLPVLVNDAFAARTGARVGEVVEAEFGTARLDVQVVSQAEAIPTVMDGPFMLADLAALSERVFQQSGAVVEADEVWASAPHGLETATALSAALPRSKVTVRRDLLAELRADPFGSAGLGSAVLASVAAAVLALVGFASGAVTLARERAQEFSFLQALGATGRQIGLIAATEAAVAAAAAVAGGLALGVLAAQAVVPVVLLTRQATVPFPGAQVPVPWGLLGLVALGFACVLAVVVVSAVVGVRRRGVAAPLRIGGAA